MKNAYAAVFILLSFTTPSLAGDANHCLHIGYRGPQFLNICNSCNKYVTIEWEDSTGTWHDGASAGGCTSINPKGNFTYSGNF